MCFGCCMCLLLILVPVVSYCAPGTLNRVWAKTQELDSRIQEVDVQTLSTRTPILLDAIDAEIKPIQVFNISSNTTDEFVRGLYLELLQTTQDIEVYFCSRTQGVINSSSVCGSFFYYKVDMALNKKILERGVSFLVIDASAAVDSSQL